MVALSFATFTLCVLLLILSWRILEYYYIDLYNEKYNEKYNNNNGVYSNDLENGLYYYTKNQLDTIKMKNKSQPHSLPIFYY